MAEVFIYIILLHSKYDTPYAKQDSRYRLRNLTSEIVTNHIYQYFGIANQLAQLLVVSFPHSYLHQ